MNSSSRHSVKASEGYLLHAQKFTDSKVIVRLFTRTCGRISAVYRIPKKNSLVPKAFTRLALEWVGSGDLRSLKLVEEIDISAQLVGRALYCGLYLNEIMLRLLPDSHAYEKLYDTYIETIVKLEQAASSRELQEIFLRRFEFFLLTELGLGISFLTDSENNKILDGPDVFYHFRSDTGWLREKSVNNDVERSNIFSGADIVSIANQQWTKPSLKAAKRLSRIALGPLLGDAPIKSRELFH